MTRLVPASIFNELRNDPLFEDGFLSVFLRNEIEEAKPQKIKINNAMGDPQFLKE